MNFSIFDEPAAPARIAVLAMSKRPPFIMLWRVRGGSSQIIVAAGDDDEELRIRRLLDRHPFVSGRWEGRVFYGAARGMAVVMLAAALAGEAADVGLIERFEDFRTHKHMTAAASQN